MARGPLKAIEPAAENKPAEAPTGRLFAFRTDLSDVLVLSDPVTLLDGDFAPQAVDILDALAACCVQQHEQELGCRQGIGGGVVADTDGNPELRQPGIEGVGAWLTVREE